MIKECNEFNPSATVVLSGAWNYSYKSLSQSMVTFWYPLGIHLLKVNNRNTRTRCEICSKLTIKTPERRY